MNEAYTSLTLNTKKDIMQKLPKMKKNEEKENSEERECHQCAGKFVRIK